MTVPNNFKPRDYQLEALQAFDRGAKRMDLVWHRRAGKDKTCFALMAKEAARVPGLYYYVFPMFMQGRDALWDAVDSSGFPTIEHCPPNLWEKKNDHEMKLTLKRAKGQRANSIIKVVGSQDVNRLVGTNPRGIVFSEYSLQDPAVWGYMMPILTENGGWAIFNYTPRGENHAKAFHLNAAEDTNWFSSTKTVADTNAIDPEALTMARKDYLKRYGNDYLFQQEFYCSFDTPVMGAVYGKEMTKTEEEGRIGAYKYDESKAVYTFWDLGASDTTAIWFMQKDGNMFNFIDHYESFGAGMKHYADVINNKSYTYAGHILPHDADHKVQGKEEVAKSRKQMLQELGLQNIQIAPKGPVAAGIEECRMIFSRCRFDRENCKRGVQALKEYRFEWSEKNRIFQALPVHDWASHSADAFRYFAVSVDKTDVDFTDYNELVEDTYDVW
jgi:hypothetical protein